MDNWDHLPELVRPDAAVQLCLPRRTSTVEGQHRVTGSDINNPPEPQAQIQIGQEWGEADWLDEIKEELEVQGTDWYCCGFMSSHRLHSGHGCLSFFVSRYTLTSRAHIPVPSTHAYY